MKMLFAQQRPVRRHRARQRLRAYSREASVAEKLHAMVDHGLENSRMKDFFDIWALSRDFAFEGDRLSAAIAATFKRRGTDILAERPVAFTRRLAEDPTKLKQWKAFLVRARVAKEPPPFGVVISLVADFLLPSVEAARKGARYELAWPPGGPWAAPPSPGCLPDAARSPGKGGEPDRGVNQR
jgi:hypothetical protein